MPETRLLPTLVAVLRDARQRAQATDPERGKIRRIAGKADVDQNTIRNVEKLADAPRPRWPDKTDQIVNAYADDLAMHPLAIWQQVLRRAADEEGLPVPGRPQISLAEALARVIGDSKSPEHIGVRQLEKLTGISGGHIGGIYRGDNPFTLESVKALSEALGLEPQDTVEHQALTIRRMLNEKEVGREQVIRNLTLLLPVSPQDAAEDVPDLAGTAPDALLAHDAQDGPPTEATAGSPGSPGRARKRRPA